MIATDYIYGKRKSQVAAPSNPSWIYDTSTFYSDHEKIVAQRSTDLAIAIFKPSEILNGTYLAWLNGGTGSLLNINSDGTVNATAGNVYNGPDPYAEAAKFLLHAGTALIEVEGIDDNVLQAEFSGNEVTEETVFAFTIRDPNSGAGPMLFKAQGEDSFVNFSLRNYLKTWFISYKLPGQNLVQIGIRASVTNLTNFDNVVVFDLPNGSPRLRVNGTVYTTPDDGGWSSWAKYDPLTAEYNHQIRMGNTSIYGGKIGKHRHFSVWQGGRTSEEISTELMGIYNP